MDSLREKTCELLSELVDKQIENIDVDLTEQILRLVQLLKYLDGK